jgi:predicted Zn-dependent protease
MNWQSHASNTLNPKFEPEMKKLIIAFVTLLTLAACQTNPISGRSQLMLVSEDTAISASKEAYVAMLKPIEDKGKLDNIPATHARVVGITEKLVAQAITFRPETEQWQWSVHVIDDPETVNAWCMAGGRMAIYTGLIQQLAASDDEIAQVMGHEIGHALLSHTAERMSRAMAMQASMGVLAATQTDSKYGQLTLQGASLAAVVALELPNSREAESEADRIGIELAAKAGYNPNAAISLWDKMSKVGGGDGKSTFDFLSTHPAPVKRMEALAEMVPQMMPYYQDKSPRPVHKLANSDLAAN